MSRMAWIAPLALVAALLSLAVGVARSPSVAAEAGRALPMPALDVPPGQAPSAVVVVGGGCFWGIQGVFQHVKGVTGAVSGYAGGDKKDAVYEMVSTGGTGHAESVQVTFDPRQISFGQVLRIFLSVAHDPTQLNRQGPDSGPQYRSAIFPTSAEQANVARAYIAQLDAAHAFPKPIVTKIDPGRSFYPAEAYHQDFLTLHPTHPYIVHNDLPKIENLERVFPELYRAVPVLVTQ